MKKKNIMVIGTYLSVGELTSLIKRIISMKEGICIYVTTGQFDNAPNKRQIIITFDTTPDATELVMFESMVTWHNNISKDRANVANNQPERVDEDKFLAICYEICATNVKGTTYVKASFIGNRTNGHIIFLPAVHADVRLISIEEV